MDHSQAIADYTETFLQSLGFAEEIQATVNFDPESSLYTITLATSAPSLLIGYHGDNLSAMQILMSQHLFTKLGEWVNISLNVNDYRERRENALQAMADAAVEKVINSHTPYTMPALPANERRIIHVYLSEHPQVLTESVGEGRQRSVMISPKV